MLQPHGLLFDHVIVNHSRYAASSRTSSPQNSLLAVRSSALPNAPTWVGELRAIFAIEQPGTGTVHRFGFMRWFRPTAAHLSGTVWSDFSSLNVQVWDADSYLMPAESGPELLIDLQNIVSHAVRMDIVIRGQKYWATILTGRG
ncbi:hypothetical protein B0H15DRAFT_848061 [Mycena belliarum]|uniref:Uncharacterized protein n=1 Tax=Mycena belliarum TaxID=1033014 RepID=A0AAD6XSM6_9AGAR|nr:hypothetical protein B0H15DRAFT_848061 [Mycena belliae]